MQQLYYYWEVAEVFKQTRDTTYKATVKQVSY